MVAQILLLLLLVVTSLVDEVGVAPAGVATAAATVHYLEKRHCLKIFVGDPEGFPKVSPYHDNRNKNRSKEKRHYNSQYFSKKVFLQLQNEFF